jgi:hypothetical protein
MSARNKDYSLLGPFVSYEENKVSQMLPQLFKGGDSLTRCMTMVTGDTLSIEAAKSANNDYPKFTKSSHQWSKLHLLGCIEQRLPHLSLSLSFYLTSSSLSNCLSLSNSLLFFLTHTHTHSFFLTLSLFLPLSFYLSLSLSLFLTNSLYLSLSF